MWGFFLLALAIPPLPCGPAAAEPDAKLPFEPPRCGQACFYLMAKLHGKPLSWDEVKARLGDGGTEGLHSFAELAKAAEGLGLHPRGLAVSGEEFFRLPLPAIAVQRAAAGSSADHFVILLRAEPQGAVIVDPPYAPEFLDRARFAKRFTGEVLVFCNSAEEAAGLDQRLAVQDWSGRLRWPLLALAGLALVGAGFVGRGALASTAGRAGPRAWAGIALLVGLSAASAACALQPRFLFPLPPRCVIAEPEQDLGEFTEPTRKHLLAVRNEGDAPLVIQAIRSNCGCAVGKIANPAIAPGEVGYVPLELTASPGPRRVLVTLDTNDPAGPHSAQLLWSGPARPTLHPLWIEETATDLRTAVTRKIQLFYPGGRHAIKPEFVGFEGQGLKIEPGSNDPMAEPYVYTGFIEKIIGVFELTATVEPPAEPGLKEGRGKLKFRYGQQEWSFPFTMRVRFQAPAAAGGVSRRPL